LICILLVAVGVVVVVLLLAEVWVERCFVGESEMSLSLSTNSALL
jgi:uncharacterized membrane protein